jgi:hypothetical protein
MFILWCLTAGNQTGIYTGNENKKVDLCTPAIGISFLAAKDQKVSILLMCPWRLANLYSPWRTREYFL